MAFPQALMSYGNLDPETILAGSFTFARGVTPSLAVLRVLANDNFVDQVGTLSLKFDGNTISFPGCKLVEEGGRRRVQRDRGGRWTMEYLIADRRWKWQHVRIDGSFNKRLPDGRLRDIPELPLYKRSARQLAALLLDTLGESGYDVSEMPDDAWPPMLWHSQPVAGQLESLAEMFGCVVVLGLDDRVRLRRFGQGADLPVDDRSMFTSTPWTPAAPAEISLGMAPTRVQAILKLEPVAGEPDGSVVAVDDASYIPAGGWESQWPDAFPGVSEDDRHLAFMSVWRWFRVVGAEDGSLDIPGVPFKLDSIEQILPLRDTLLDTAEQRPGVLGAVPCYLEGEIYQQGDLPVVAPFRRLNTDFTLDRENGIVKLPYPLYSLGSDGLPRAPELYLTTSFEVRLLDGEWWKNFQVKSVPGGSGPAIQKVCSYLWDVVGCSTNSTSVINAEMQSVALAIATSLSPSVCDDMTYDGFVALELDGAIAQSHWEMPHREPAFTRIGRNVEVAASGPSHDERRTRERLRQLWEERNDATT